MNYNYYPFNNRPKLIRLSQDIPFLWLRRGQEGRIVGRCGDMFEIEVVRNSGQMQMIPLQFGQFYYV